VDLLKKRSADGAMCWPTYQFPTDCTSWYSLRL